MRLTIALSVLAAVAIGCGGESAGGECGFSPDLLPYEVGNNWTYGVTDVMSSERTIKQQRLDRTENHADYGQVIVQITQKNKGSTESFLRREGDEVRRYEQRDYNELGELQRTTIYQPYRLRIHEGLALNETYTDTYDKVVIKPGVADVTTRITDVWEVTGEDESCTTNMGSFTCVKYNRVRTEGGVAVKDFWFAEGVGKVIEDGSSQVEELEGCGSTP